MSERAESEIYQAATDVVVAYLAGNMGNVFGEGKTALDRLLAALRVSGVGDDKLWGEGPRILDTVRTTLCPHGCGKPFELYLGAVHVCAQ